MNFAKEYTRRHSLLVRTVVGTIVVSAIGVLATPPAPAAGSLSFTENVGQYDAAVKYRADAGGATLWITNDGIYHHFMRVIDATVPSPESVLQEPSSLEFDQFVIKADLVGANPSLTVIGETLLPHKTNYFIGNDPSAWKTDVANYAQVRYSQVYQGIDLVIRSDSTQVEYDFVVAPGCNPAVIRIAYQNVISVVLNADGDLEIETDFGTLIEKKPVAFQSGADGSGTNVVECEFDTLGGTTFGFCFPTGYDSSQTLVIDPVLVYSTYLGSGGETGWAIDVDADGNAYVTGQASSATFPTVNPFQPDQPLADAFVTKFNADGSGLVYSTYIGGSGYEWAVGIAVDQSGNAYISGRTPSTDFPTQNPMQASFGGAADAFVTKLNAAGNGLIYSTYLGGSSHEYCHGIAVDGSGRAYICGSTLSLDYPLQNPYQITPPNSYKTLAFLSRLNAAGTALEYSTYIGGTNHDIANDVAVDASGNAYIIGMTISSDYPIQNPIQTNQRTRDAFVTKFNSTGSALVYSTYLGGYSIDIGYSIDVDAAGRAYVTGQTFSTDFPMQNAIQPAKAGDYDAFVARLNAAGSALEYSTYLGGSGYESTFLDSIEVIGSGEVVVTGYTFSTYFPTLGPTQASNAGNGDAYLTHINASGTGYVYSTYIGGTNRDYGYGVAADADGCAFVTGFTRSTDFPTQGAYDPSLGGFVDAFVTKVCPGNPPEGSVAGTVTADCPAAGTGLLGVGVDAFELGTGDLAASAVTDVSGNYDIASLPIGDYTITIVTPLGYSAAVDEIAVTVLNGGVATADFALTCVEIIGTSPNGGFWKHQIGVTISGTGNAQIDAASLCDYLDLIADRFNGNQINPVVVYVPPASGTCADKLLVAKDLLNLQGDVGMTARARQQLMVLLLNAAAGNISLTAIVSADGATVSQAITYCDNLIDDPAGDHETAKTVCDLINNNRQVASGVIPLATQNIAYRTTAIPDGFGLHQNYPNPFNAGTIISYSLEDDGPARLEIFDILGRSVITLADEVQTVGLQQVVWNGTDRKGRTVSSGMYFYRLTAGEVAVTKKMVLLK